MNEEGWNFRLLSFSDPHFLQTKEWAAIKSPIGWVAHTREWKDENGQVVAAAQMLVRSIRLFRFGPKISVGYIPRGPLLDWTDLNLRRQVLEDLEQWAREENLIFLKIDPAVELGRGIPGALESTNDPVGERVSLELETNGWKYSPDQVQFKNTVILDISDSEEVWLTRMKQKTRYNLRLAQKNGVMVRTASLADLPQLFQMYAETAKRDSFIIRPETYYLEVWRKFIQAGMAEALIAEVNGTVVAGLVYFHLGKLAWYVYGMSTNLHREKMPNYLLQWEAMRSAKTKGCLIYDLWGAPEVFQPDDPMFGVYRFKEGLGGVVIRTIGAWDLPIKKIYYFAFQQLIPRVLSLTRFFRKSQIQQEVQ